MSLAVAEGHTDGDDPVRRDWRLPLAAAGAWGAALVVLHGDTATGALVAIGCALATTVGRRRRHGLRAAVATVAFGGMLAAAVTAVHVTVRDDDRLTGLVEAEAGGKAELVLDEPPRPSSRSPGVYTLSARMRSFAAGEETVSGHWRVFVVASGDEWAALTSGQRVSVDAGLREPEAGRLTAAVVGARGPPETTGGPPAPHRFAAHVRERLTMASESVAQPESGLIPALAVGDASRMDPELAQDFRDTGLVHLVVVSGYHLSLVAGAALAVALALRAGPRTRVAVGAGAVAAIVVVAGPQPSVLRAAVMTAMMLIALAVGRPRASMPALSTAVLVLILADPDMAAQVGFALSVAACAGLLLLAFAWARPLEHRGWPQPVALAVTVPVAAQVAVTPLLVGWFGQISLVSIPANLLATLVAAPVVVLSVLAAALAAVWLPAGEWCAWSASLPARWLVWLAETGADVPGGVVTWPTGAWWGLLAAAILALVVGLLHVRRLRRPLIAVVVVVALGAIPACLIGERPPSGWVVTMCDVGQGDALVLPAGEAVVVVDAGPDPSAVDRCLDGLGVEHVAMLVVSHFHIDHAAGIAGVMDGRRVDAILAPPPGEARYGYDIVADRAGEVPVLDPVPGDAYEFGTTRLEVLAPPPEPLSGTRSDPNNNSVAIRADVAGTGVLLTGDVELEAQRWLMDAGSALDVEVLKVPHHGSAYQLPEFLEAADPVVALVGVGADNDYGHPDPGPLGLLRDAGADVFRTDVSGSITVARNQNAIEVTTERGG